MITFEAVSKTYSKEIGVPSSKAVDGLSFSVTEGEVLGLIGANGAGKSTTIKLLMNFIKPDKGEITVFETAPEDSSTRITIGYLPEVANFPANLSVYDLLIFTGTTCNISRQTILDRGAEILQILDLWAVRKRPLRTYSKGMQQRANFAIALINNPNLLILDEPMSGLDPIGRSKIIDLILKLKEEGKTILFCSHILEDVDKLVDNVLLLHRGKKIFHGTPGSLVLEQNCSSIAEAFVRVVKKEDFDE